MKTNLVNQNFGCVSVKNATTKRDSHGTIIWECLCNKCNSIVYYSTRQLKSRKILQCSKCQECEEIGKKYGRLLVIKKDLANKKIGVHWLCQCECGKTVSVSTNSLHAGTVQSCGCLQKEIASSSLGSLDLSNRTFGKWKVLYKTDKRNSSRQVLWHCKCSCENKTERDISGSELIRGSTLSCGCLRVSHGEYKIAQLLSSNQIPYETEKTFENCIFNESGAKARFDFFVNNSYLIEFDGVQHYKPTWSIEDLDNTQKRDHIKNEWCKNNDIPLIRIPYTKLNTLKIEDLLLETSQYKIC